MRERKKRYHVLKFISYLKKNNDIPFVVKHRIFDTVLTSTLLNGCEFWFGAEMRSIEKLYNWSVKGLLGVRRSAPNMVCSAEIFYQPLSMLVKSKQRKFFF